MALCATSSYYDVTEMATRILPNIVVLDIDQDSDVRLKAFQAVDQFLQIARQYTETNSGDTAGPKAGRIPSMAGDARLLGWAMSSLTHKGKPSEQTSLSSANSLSPVTPEISSATLVGTSIVPVVRVNSSTDIADLRVPESPTLNDGWGELENGLHEELESEKDGWDDIESLEEPKPPAALANIQAAQKQPVSQPKLQASNLQPKFTVKMPKDEDDDLWGTIAAPAPKSASKPLNIKSSSTVDDDDPWAAIAAPPPTTKAKPLSAGRGRGNKPAAPRLGAQRINRTSSWGNEK